MKKFFLYGAAIIALVILVLGFIAPKEIIVKRTVSVDKPIEEVYEYMKSLKNMGEWSPWAKIDPKAKHSFFGVDGTVGSGHKWESENQEVGVGEQEVMALIPNKEVKFEMRFKSPMEETAAAGFEFENNGIGTDLSWYYISKPAFIPSIFLLFIDLDKIVGEKFEKGLADAKLLMEK